MLFPTPEEFHDGVDEPRNAKYRVDEFAGITAFPFTSVELSLLAVHPCVVALAEALLGTEDLRLYSAEAWAKYTGATDYDQRHHRDYLNHTVLVPTEDLAFRQVEKFLHLCDVPEELEPPHFVSKTRTKGVAALPNWLSRDERPDWYATEVSGTGPTGTVAAYSIGTFHRGTEFSGPRGARNTIHVNYRAAITEWANRNAWAKPVARARVVRLCRACLGPAALAFWVPSPAIRSGSRRPWRQWHCIIRGWTPPSARRPRAAKNASERAKSMVSQDVVADCPTWVWSRRRENASRCQKFSETSVGAMYLDRQSLRCGKVVSFLQNGVT